MSCYYCVIHFREYWCVRAGIFVRMCEYVAVMESKYLKKKKKKVNVIRAYVNMGTCTIMYLRTSKIQGSTAGKYGA